MMKINISFLVERSINQIYEILTDNLFAGNVVRLALTILDIWQVFVVWSNNALLAQLIGTTIPPDYYLIVSVILATASFCSLISPSTLLALIVLVLNIVEFMYLTFSALFFQQPPPLFSAGLFLFVTLVCIGGFWRVLLLHLRIHTRS